MGWKMNWRKFKRTTDTIKPIKAIKPLGIIQSKPLVGLIGLITTEQKNNKKIIHDLKNPQVQDA